VGPVGVKVTVGGSGVVVIDGVKVRVGEGIGVKVNDGVTELVMDGVSVKVGVSDGGTVAVNDGVGVSDGVSVGKNDVGIRVGKAATCCSRGKPAILTTTKPIVSKVRSKNRIEMALNTAARLTVDS
jgi:hypothetical protein